MQTDRVHARLPGIPDLRPRDAAFDRGGTALLWVPVVLLLGVAPLLAQDGPTGTDSQVDACAGPESHRFDFWPGTWDVESRRRGADGGWVETRETWRAEEVLGGCAFVDFVEGDFGAGPMKGMGSRFWDPAAGEWVITWLSTAAPGQMGTWRGTFDGSGRGEFLQEAETPDGTVLSRIAWYDLTEDSAGWDHAVSVDGGETWRTTWEMRFRRASGGAR